MFGAVFGVHELEPLRHPNLIVSSVLSWQQFMFINTDLTVYLHRQPEGEWICLDASTDVDRHGVGVAHSRLYDERGPIGRSLQGLFIDRLRVTPPQA